MLKSWKIRFNFSTLRPLWVRRKTLLDLVLPTQKYNIEKYPELCSVYYYLLIEPFNNHYNSKYIFNTSTLKYKKNMAGASEWIYKHNKRHSFKTQVGLYLQIYNVSTYHWYGNRSSRSISITVGGDEVSHIEGWCVGWRFNFAWKKKHMGWIYTNKRQVDAGTRTQPPLKKHRKPNLNKLNETVMVQMGMLTLFRWKFYDIAES